MTRETPLLSTTDPRPRRTLRWPLLVVVVSGLTGLVFVAQVLVTDVRPGDPWGIAWGVAATACLLIAMAYGVRRRLVRLASRQRYGKARSWLQLHLFTGSLFLLLVGLHTGFSMPNGVLTWWLFGLSIWIVASGLVGLALQRWLPKALSALSVEVLYERIPELCDQLRERAKEVAASSDEPVQVLYERRLAPMLEAPRRRLRFLFDVTGGVAVLVRELEYLRGFLDAGQRSRVDELEAIFRCKLELDAHYTLQPALRLWLALHLPASLVLVGLVVIHVLAVVWY